MCWESMRLGNKKKMDALDKTGKQDFSLLDFPRIGFSFTLVNTRSHRSNDPRIGIEYDSGRLRAEAVRKDGLGREDRL